MTHTPQDMQLVRLQLCAADQHSPCAATTGSWRLHRSAVAVSNRRDGRGWHSLPRRRACLTDMVPDSSQASGMRGAVYAGTCFDIGPGAIPWDLGSWQEST